MTASGAVLSPMRYWSATGHQDSPYLYPSFDWMDFYFKPAVDQHYNLNARGGNDFVHYFTSLSYLQEGDVFTVGENFSLMSSRARVPDTGIRGITSETTSTSLSTPTQPVLSFNIGGNLKVWNKPVDDYTQEIWFEPVTVMPFYPELKQYNSSPIPGSLIIRQVQDQ
jgi:hypothetical protein